MKKRVGILALQGDFEAHAQALARAGAEPVLVRTAEEMETVDGLIIPGGESTTMLKLLELMNLKEALRTFAARKPVFGTCAGLIGEPGEVLHVFRQTGEDAFCFGVCELPFAYDLMLLLRICTPVIRVSFQQLPDQCASFDHYGQYVRQTGNATETQFR